MADSRTISLRTATLRVCSFESRRADEMRSLIERQGGVATVAPSLREVPLDVNTAAFEFAEARFGGRIDAVIFMTGVGARTLLETLQPRYPQAGFFAALDRCEVIVRGPKPTAVLREWKVRIDHRAPEPNTWRELLAVLDAEHPVAGKRVAVQEYGQPNREFYDALRERGADVTAVPVYRWALPEDTGPLVSAIRATIEGGHDVLMFTSAYQLHNVLEVAESVGLRDEWLRAAGQCVLASIGPTTSDALAEAGLPVHLEASPPKMGQLVKLVFEEGPKLVADREAAAK
jgi:uroporphyrinogen-III synthase